jgi:hypothetical protein
MFGVRTMWLCSYAARRVRWLYSAWVNPPRQVNGAALVAFVAAAALGDRWYSAWYMDSAQTGSPVLVPGWYPSTLFVGICVVLYMGFSSIIVGWF